MSTLLKFTACAATLLIASQASAYDLPDGDFLFEFGAYMTSPGEDQDIDIENLLGNEYTVDNKTRGNALLGAGYYFHAMEHERFKLDAGINAFYLYETMVTGDVIQEYMFENLSYDYQVSHIPVYAAAKGTIFTDSKKYAFTVDVGLGVNFLMTSDFDETSLDGITIPDAPFENTTNAVFSAMAGVGFEILKIAGDHSLEIDYRFFYLGEGEMGRPNSQFEDGLSTGTIYGNAFFFTVKI